MILGDFYQLLQLDPFILKQKFIKRTLKTAEIFLARLVNKGYFISFVCDFMGVDDYFFFGKAVAPFFNCIILFAVEYPFRLIWLQGKTGLA